MSPAQLLILARSAQRGAAAQQPVGGSLLDQVKAYEAAHGRGA